MTTMSWGYYLPRVKHKYLVHMTAVRLPKHTQTYVLNGSNDTGSEDKLFPGLAKVDQVDTISTALEDIGGHAGGDVLGTNVALSAQQELNVLLGGAENCNLGCMC